MSNDFFFIHSIFKLWDVFQCLAGLRTHWTMVLNEFGPLDTWEVHAGKHSADGCHYNYCIRLWCCSFDHFLFLNLLVIVAWMVINALITFHILSWVFQWPKSYLWLKLHGLTTLWNFHFQIFVASILLKCSLETKYCIEP